MERSLTLAPLILFGISFMGLGSVFSTYGIAVKLTHGRVPSAYILALVAMVFTALSYGKMASAYPVSGSAYTYVQKAISPHAGFLVGWSILVDYLFLPMVNYLIFGTFLHAAIPGVPQFIWILGMLALVTFVNIRGIKLASKVNLLINIFSALFIVLFCFFTIKHIITNEGAFSLFTVTPFYQPEGEFSSIIAGASILCFSFLGFDSVTTFAEEVKNPKKVLPKAILIITFIGGGVFTLVSYLAQVVYPNYTSFSDPDSASYVIIQYIGGSFLSSLFILMISVGAFGSAMVSHASVARLLYSMGRDGVLPKKVFGVIHTKYKTPFNNLLIVSAISLASLFMSLATAASLIDFGAFLAFICVNLSVIAHYYLRQKKRSTTGTIKYLLFPIVGMVADVWLLFSLDFHSKIVGIIWFCIGFVYLLIITKVFKQRTPEIQMDSVETL
ncbi:amino acid permease [Bacillus salipaludis]|uniref:APC family permease n=1 Tax=Bacillus salipaludis TaxID=2547811 RepID=UPI003D1A16A6